MPRVTGKTKNSAGVPYDCVKCSEKIRAKEPYYEWSFRYGGTYRQHQSHGRPKPSQLTQSKMSGVYSAIEGAEDDIAAADTAEDISLALNTCADEVDAVKDEYQSSIDNLPEQFQSSTPIQEKVDALDEFISALQNAASDIEGDEFEDDEPEEDDPKHDEWENKRSEHIEGLRQQAYDALGEFNE